MTTRLPEGGRVSSHDCKWTGVPITVNGVEHCPICFDHDAAPISAGRNDPCPCGSGKKFKKCHG